MQMISRDDIQAFVDKVVERFKPRQVILFGSYADGNPNDDSDVDLMVVMPHRAPGPQVAAKIRQACTHAFPIDLIVRSPAEIRRRPKIGDTFLRDITSKGIVLHEADHP